MWHLLVGCGRTHWSVLANQSPFNMSKVNGQSESQENTPFSRRDFVTYTSKSVVLNIEITLSYFLCLCEIVLINTTTCSEWTNFYCNFCLENSEFFQESSVTQFTMVILKVAQLIMFKMINVLISIILWSCMYFHILWFLLCPWIT